MKTHKKILVLALALAATAVVGAPLAAQGAGMVLVKGGTFTMGNTDQSKKNDYNADEFPAHKEVDRSLERSSHHAGPVLGWGWCGLGEGKMEKWRRELYVLQKLWKEDCG